ncbi:hypothetical protein OG884_34030 [Streptosporangium sp. NBC_01755]|uniref:hypothetical protein n=1 Tax=unclassified Streptosporangium TaxID=2632669 RepID=UPI002DDB65A5|nr:MULTISPECIES: hypothetical protein [unclassified Streptosporangium]WSA28784.1 hypothetical protein OIE13_13430 [Streptosporangium sp. NBC_01810]WSC99765.1 hypothetical protein OG884_34030 [Streptosporangium sp. NBC_01755]
MKDKISIVVMVDAVGALSDRTLHNGNLSLIDDSEAGSKHQGTPDLVTVVVPGQVVHWTPIHVDVQTPVEIQAIEFLAGATVPPPADQTVPYPADQTVPPYPVEPSTVPAPDAVPGTGADAMDSNGHENHDLLVWEGVVPYDMTPGVPYRYRLTLKLHEGPNSVLHIDSPALLRV